MTKEIDGVYGVFDCETYVKNKVGSNPGSAFCPENKLHMFGQIIIPNRSTTSTFKAPIMFAPAIHDPSISLAIGHAFGFDLHWLMREWAGFKEKLLPKIAIWDTQLAEYILSNQQLMYPSLDETAIKYSGTLKDNRISTMWEAGMQTEDIPEDMLEEYLRNDVENTHKIFLGQIQKAQERGILPLMVSQMDALIATTEMSYNGIKIDTQELVSKKHFYETEVSILQKKLDNICIKYAVPDYKPGSRRAISDLLFGRVIIDKDTGESRVYNGFGFPTEKEWKQKTGIMNTGEEVLEELLKNPWCDPESKYVIDTILNLREKEKILNTYIIGTEKHIFPDGFIHPNINHCVARTGRTSSSNPNLQNQVNGEFKKVFVPRNPNGLLIEADFGQIEIVALAYLSQDKQLIYDLNTGIDIHTALFMDMYHVPPTKEERKAFKPLTFGLIYGAGPKTLAKQGKVPLSVAKNFIEAFYRRYPQVQDWHTNILLQASANGESLGKKTKLGMPAKTYKQTVLGTGRVLEYTEYDNEYKGRGAVSFSPTEIKNYPVQSFATADIVPLVLGKLYRVLKNHPVLADKCLMIMTIHDSILFDLSDPAYLSDSIEVIKSVMEQAPAYLKGTFGIDMGLRLTTGITAGKNWYDMKEYSKEYDF